MIIYDVNGRPLRKAGYSPPAQMHFAQPADADVRPVDPVMTNLSIGYKNESFMWDKIAPVAEVVEASGTYFRYTRDFWMRRQEGAERGTGAPYLRVGYGLETSKYATIELGFEAPLDEVTKAKSQTPEDLSDTNAAFLSNLMQLELEKRTAEELFTTSIWGTDNALSSTTRWNIYDTSNPVDDMDVVLSTVRRNTGMEPNVFFIGRPVWDVLKDHPMILDRYKYSQPAIMTTELVAAVLNIPKIIVGNTVENTAKEGQTYVGADIWGDKGLVSVMNAPGLMIPAGAFTFIWNEKGNMPWAIDSYYEPQTRSDIDRIFTHRDAEVVSNHHGYFFSNLVN